MKIYITRHGQTSPGGGYINGDYRYPSGEVPLSDMGREQARILAEKLKEYGFCGKIFSSPYLRTMETAEIIAETLDTVIYPLPCIREIFMKEESANKYVGSTIETLRHLFSRVAKDATLPEHWWGNPHLESGEDVSARVFAGMDEFPFDKLDGDVLFVGHGASTWRLLQYFKIPPAKGRRLYNCSLSITSRDEDIEPVYCDTSFFSEDMTTSNLKTKAMLDAEDAEKAAQQE